MRSVMHYRDRGLRLAVLLLTSMVVLPVHAVTLNFSAFLTSGTCTFNLDKSTLDLGTVSAAQLQPSTLVNAQPFTLTVSACTGTDLNLMPVVNISGEGITQDGRWLFRTSDSTTGNKMGVMLAKTDVSPDYSATEVNNNDDIVLAAQGVNPADQNLTFYAGMTCGSTGCTGLQPGTLMARVFFQLAYR